jgi:hypothetical protein
MSPEQQQARRQCIFLDGKSIVLRCTSEPFQQIAKSLIAALQTEKVVRGDHSWELSESTRRELSGNLEAARGQTPEDLRRTILDAVGEIGRALPGSLTLVFDQVEQVLARTTGRGSDGSESLMLLRLLEDIYLRNMDVRAIVSLRTEYYGRFRDELRISDDRLLAKPRSGGIESYLLRPIRDVDALERIVLTPTGAKHPDGSSVYNFSFEPDLVNALIDDLLKKFPHASVTPALQVACASLYDELPPGRVIRRSQYNQSGRLEGILRRYLSKGVREAITNRRSEAKVYRLLHSLVSRQGGGTVVSLTEPSETLKARGLKLEIKEDIDLVLKRLTDPPAPLLIADSPDQPSYFTLRHDVLAVALSQWFDEFEAEQKLQSINTARRRRAAVLAAFLFVVVGAVLYSKEHLLSTTRAQAIAVKTHLAARPPASDFRTSVLLLLHGLDSASKPADVVDWAVSGHKQAHMMAASKFREVLARVPWFSGKFEAIGLNRQGREIALLTSSSMAILRLPEQEDPDAAPSISNIEIKRVSPPGRSNLGPAVGFLDEIGPAAYIDGILYFRGTDSNTHSTDLYGKMPESFKSGVFPRVEFVKGKLQVTLLSFKAQSSSVSVLPIDARDILQNRVTFPALPPPALFTRPSNMPLPRFTRLADGTQIFLGLQVPPIASLSGETLPGETSMRSSNDDQNDELDLAYGPVTSSGMIHSGNHRIPLARIMRENSPDRPRFTFAIVPNSNRVAFTMNGKELYIHALNAGEKSLERRLSVQADEKLLRPRGALFQWYPPPFAAVEAASGWRAAWLSDNGVLAVAESRRGDPQARSMSEGPLLTGGGGGNLLDFDDRGNFLVLQQQMQFNAPVTVRVWNLSEHWLRWIETADLSKLRLFACRAIANEEGGARFLHQEAEAFGIGDDYQACER